MQFFENEIKEYAEFAWSTLDFKASPSSESINENPGNTINANIQISGQWQGIVAMKIERGLAQQLAVKMFSVENGKATDIEIKDAVSEMMNIIGGNLKSILPQPNQLSLPMIDMSDNSVQFPFTELRSEVVFECESMKFVIAIHQVTGKKFPKKPSKEQTSAIS